MNDAKNPSGHHNSSSAISRRDIITAGAGLIAAPLLVGSATRAIAGSMIGGIAETQEVIDMGKL